ncbi:NmrA family protein [Purpureocillium lavendulum]|uniref:NmrA family protein n=1 Tax=Purpureocillium lavendulum TaxID=1247861 RepID=A0AB34G5I2_9HYPO|nr:NmrA family protein [Purpureocillium lavendulum]
MAQAPHPATAGTTTIRRAQGDDVPDIHRIVTAAYTKYIDRIGKPPAPMLADYGQLLLTHDVFVLAAGHDGAVVGSIVLGVNEDQRDAVQINNLVVDPAAQGRGYGKTLMRCAEDFARENGRAALELYTNVKMHENFALYAKMGFDEVDRRTEDGYERVYFRKGLGDKSEIPVQADDSKVEDPIDETTANSDAQLERDDAEAIDKSNIINERTRHAEPQGGYRPPVRYPHEQPSVSISTSDVVLLRSPPSPVSAGSDSTTLRNPSDCDPPSPRQPPAYGAEGAPPQYQEELVSGAKSKAKRRKTLLVRLLTSIFITVLVSLIVAAVVGRIHDRQGNGAGDAAQNQSTTTTQSVERFTMSSDPTPLQGSGTTVSPTALPTTFSTVTTATSSASHANPTLPPLTTVDCASLARLTGATPVTSIQQTQTARDRKIQVTEAAQPADEGSEMVGVAVYEYSGCLWAKASYKFGIGDSLAYKCTVACPPGKRDGDDASERNG